MSSVPALIVTKILPPRRGPELLHRTRLVDFLHANIDRKLILISAPAGYGKTSLLIDFAHDTDLPVCWYSLDQFDQDSRIFLEHFIGAIRQRYPNFGQRSSTLLRSMTDLQRSMYSLVATLVDEIYEQIPEYFVLILDDYQFLDDQDDINEFLAHFLRCVGENCHLILSSRTLPALPNLALLAARDQIAGLGVEELKFTSAEVQQLVRQNYHLDLPEEQAKQLCSDSEGWITGILLSAHSMWRRLLQGAAQGRKVDVYDFLAEQVFSQQPPEVQEFLLTTSVLEEMNPHLCDELLEQEGSAQMLAALRRRNLFIVDLEGEEGWYRYHHLFRDFLRERLRERTPERFRRICRRVAQLYERRGEWAKAVEKYLALQAYEDVTRIVQEVGQEFLSRGRLESLASWLDALPEEFLQQRPNLLVFRGRIHLERAEYPAALALFDQALQRFSMLNNKVRTAEVLMRIGVVLRLQGRYREAIEYCERSLALLSNEDEAKTIAAEAHKNIGLGLFRLGELSPGMEELQKALELYKRAGDSFNIANTHHDLGMLYRAAGQLDQVLEHYQLALGYWQQVNNLGAWANTLNSLGVLYHLRGEYERAEETLEEALLKARQAGNLRIEAWGLASIGDFYRDLGRYDEAQRAYQRGVQIGEQINDSFIVTYALDALANLHRLMGDLERARNLAEQALQRARHSGSRYQVAVCQTSLGALKCWERDFPRALEYLTQSRQTLEKLGFRWELAKTHLYLAQTLFLARRSREALDHLSTALDIAPSWGRLPLLTAEGQGMTPLFNHAVSAGVGNSLLRRALATIAARERVSAEAEVVAEKVPQPTLEIYAFGQAQVFLNSELVTNWVTATTKELFFYFLTHPQGLRKEQIGVVFWPDHSPEKLNGIFRSTMYRLRRALFRDIVLYEDGIYRFNPELKYWLDVEEFEGLLDRAERMEDREAKVELLKRAVELYRGDYLEEFGSEWCALERENLRTRFITAMIELADLLMEMGDLDGALHYYNRTLAYDPLQEIVYRRAMECYARLGDRASAAEKYRQCVEALQRELGLEPMRETRETYRRIMG